MSFRPDTHQQTLADSHSLDALITMEFIKPFLPEAKGALPYYMLLVLPLTSPKRSTPRDLTIVL